MRALSGTGSTGSRRRRLAVLWLAAAISLVLLGAAPATAGGRPGGGSGVWAITAPITVRPPATIGALPSSPGCTLTVTVQAASSGRMFVWQAAGVNYTRDFKADLGAGTTTATLTYPW